jgi:hypothetical protein
MVLLTGSCIRWTGAEVEDVKATFLSVEIRSRRASETTIVTLEAGISTFWKNLEKI